MTSEPILKVRDVVKRFGDVTALDGVSIDVNKGEVVSFLGPSGCGKTTLLRTIGGFYQQDQGDIFLDGRLINHLPPEKRETVMFFQNYALFPHMTVFENVTYGLKVNKLPKEEINQKAKDILELIQLEGMENRQPSQLSGGQQQRVALARALILNPKLLLLDEPLSNLDAKLREHMRDEIKKIQERLGLTIIFVTHDQHEAMSMANKIAVMRHGVIEQVGHPFDIYRYPESYYVANFVGDANFLDSTVEAIQDQSLDVLSTVGHLRVLKHKRSFQVGDAVQTVIRPENIEIVTSREEHPKDNNIIQGKVLKSTYFGELIRYEVQLKDEVLLVKVSNPKERDYYPPGSEIKLRIPTDIHVIEPDTERGAD